MTEFLRSRNIRVDNLYNRRDRGSTEATTPATEPEEAQAAVDEQEELNAQVAAELSAQLEAEPPKKRRRVAKKKKGEEDEAYEPEDERDYGRSAFSHKNRPAPGKIDFCAKCNCRFTVTIYDKVDPESGGLLCSVCGSADKGKAAERKAKPAIRKKRAKALLDGEIANVPKLGDSCIQLIAEHIEDVEVLGDIGHVNMDKICQIISRNRSLTSETVQLFFDPSLKTLSLYDCAKISGQKYMQLAQMCPNLETLRLHMCGQITDENILFFAKHLTNLKHIILRGSFLVTVHGWTQFFEMVGARLEGFELSSTSRFNFDTIQALVANCPNLTTLTLSKLTHLNDEMVASLASLTQLTHLDLSHSGETINDASVIEVLSQVGPQLVTLDLSGLRELTDDVLISGVLLHCTNIQNLILNDLDLLTDEGVCLFFHDWNARNPALLTCQLERCPKVKDAAIASLLNHSGSNLRHLNLNSLDELSHEIMLKVPDSLPQCKTLDISWVRSVNDTIVQRICENLKTLEQLKVWGCNRVTECVSGGSCLIIGRETI